VRTVIAFLLLLVVSASFAHAGKRVALVIGNSAYQHTPKLDNPKNDAADMAAALKKQGFEVIEGFDLDKRGFDQKVLAFAAALKGSDAGVFFYAGHGMQVAGQNYLVPTDAKAEAAETLDFELVRVDVVQRIMERLTNTNILFLDACRDNPLARNLARSMGTRSSEIARGLAQVEAGIGTLISFSTQPGNVALDGTGRNSPFAGALVKHLNSSNDELSAILIAVRNDVIKETQRKQVPWEHSALTGQFYFRGTSPSGPATPVPPSQPDRSEKERAWGLIKETNDQAQLEAFFRQFPDSPYAVMARARLEELQQKVAPPPDPTSQSERVFPRPSTGRGAFDGYWRITWYDAPGCSNPHATFYLTISNDAVLSRAEGPIGRVDERGRITFSVPAVIMKGTRVRYFGHLIENSGRGQFSNASGRCAGSFTATRQ
jgi:uncharacterized caspase-like protein